MGGIIQRSSRFTTGQDMKLTKRQQEILNQLAEWEYQEAFDDVNCSERYVNELEELMVILKESEVGND